MTAEAGPSSLRLPLEPPSPSTFKHRSDDPRPSPASRQAPLSERLHRLWTERGDFSKFSVDDLEDDDELRETVKTDRDPASDGLQIDWGAGGEEAATELPAGASSDKDAKGKDKEIDTSPMTVEELVKLKEEMMSKLSVAQQSLYFSQILVSLLVASQRPRNAPPAQVAALALDGNAAASRGGSHAPPSRAESPGASSSAGGTMADKRHPAGSAAAVEAEYGLDPYSITLAGIEQMEVKEPDEQEEEEEREGEEAGPSVRLPEFSNESERAECTKKLQLAMASKRQSVVNAIDILRAGAKRLEGTDTSESTQDGATRTTLPTASASERWRALRQAQASGWGLTPGRPGRPAHQSGGYYAMRSDEGEQDAWIGFGPAESRSVYRRTALAYLSHEAKDHEGQDWKSTADRLVFVRRIKRRLRITLVSSNGDQPGKTLSSTSLGQTDLLSEKTIDDRLRAAQAELIEREIFDDIAGQARLLAAQDIVTCQQTDHSAEVALGNGLSLLFEMVATDQKDEAESIEGVQANDGNTSQQQDSPQPLMSLLLAASKLTLLKRYQERANEAKKAAATSKQQQALAPLPSTATNASANRWQPAPYLMLVLSLGHYFSFISQLRHLLTELSKSAKGRKNQVSFEIEPFQSIASEQQTTDTGTTTMLRSWLLVFLESDRPQEAVAALSGSAIISSLGSTSKEDEAASTSLQTRVILTFSSPSNLTVQLPFRKTLRGEKGVTLTGVELEHLREILEGEL